MRTFVRSALCLSLGLGFLSGCGKAVSDTSAKLFSGENFRIIEGEGTLSITPNKLSGTGKVMADRFGDLTQQNYALKFKLPDGGKLTLIVRAKVDGIDGTHFAFERKGNTIKFFAGGQDHTADLAGRIPDASAELDIAIDVHDEAQDEAIFFVNNIKSGNTAPGKLSVSTLQKRWGLVLNNATVTSVVLDVAKDPHP